ncbi:MAG TPA: hypothetical protein VJ044_06110, partial [Candidatus Hodarchaeales archaeon]|nr:hypothetical protein [Candidatus Hodarchaeales archaeon]
MTFSFVHESCKRLTGNWKEAIPVLNLLFETISSGRLCQLLAIEQDRPKGFTFFVHGFNSSSEIWGDRNTGLVQAFYEIGFNCYAINFSNSVTNSIRTLADEEL